MNKSIITDFRHSYIYGVIALASICTSCFGTAPDKQHGRPTESEEFPSSLVSAPDVPTKVAFAGQEVDLTRYDMRERMDRELINFSYMHTSSLLIIKRANRYFPVVEPILKQQGIPDDFKYLMLVESNLVPTARSGAGAVGMWQMIEAAGKEYGLTINSNIDERLHIEKATIAACRYLKAAFAKYGDWMSVAASYNAGQARIARALNTQQVDTATDLWINDETSRYMFRILAAKIIFSEPQNYGFVLRASQLYPPMNYATVTVDTTITSLIRFAKEQNISYHQLKDANLWLRDTTLTNKSRTVFEIAIPTQESLYYDPRKTKAHNPAWVVKP